MLSTLTFLDCIIGAGMGLLLLMASIYDAHGTAVPDSATVPYALLGCCESFIHGRYIIAAIALTLSIYIMQPRRGRMIKAVNNWFVRRAYVDEEALKKSEEASSCEAGEFEQIHGQLLHKLLLAVYFLITTATILYSIWFPENALKGVPVLIPACIMPTVSAALQMKRQMDAVSPPQQAPDWEPIGAIGGADVLVLAGILGFYGIIPFLFGVTASMMVYLTIATCCQIARRKKGSGYPMLPVMMITLPIRVVLAYTICQPIIESFGWLASHGIIYS